MALDEWFYVVFVFVPEEFRVPIRTFVQIRNSYSYEVYPWHKRKDDADIYR